MIRPPKKISRPRGFYQTFKELTSILRNLCKKEYKRHVPIHCMKLTFSEYHNQTKRVSLPTHQKREKKENHRSISHMSVDVKKWLTKYQ